MKDFYFIISQFEITTKDSNLINHNDLDFMMENLFTIEIDFDVMVILYFQYSKQCCRENWKKHLHLQQKKISNQHCKDMY
jgi:hypothetical protein